jgi:peptidoglycan/xylan/chitin deacetylase (PgdA/CDA1 family)
LTRGTLVLCYHAASTGWRHDLSLPPQEIERQVAQLLQRRFRPATAADVVAGASRSLHVTFDDAYRSVRNILPVLARLGVPATVFVCSDYADRPRPLGVSELTAEAARNPSELETMGWSELRELADAGVEIGSHTRTHPHLTTLSDEELREELVASREQIEAELGRPCPYFAYPYGEHDARVGAAVRAAGYEAAFALLDGAVNERFALPRIDIYPPDRGLRFLLKTEPVVARPIAAFKRRAAAARGRIERAERRR